MTRVLIIDDEESICWGLAKLCTQMKLESASASSAERGLELARETKFDLVIMDIRLPGMDGITAIEHFQQLSGKPPVITITAFGDLQTAIDAIQKGAFEYIVKPFDLETVRSKIQQAMATRKLLESNDRSAGGDETDRDNKGRDRGGLIGASPRMQEVFKQIALTTTSESPVLITGESGTGKELTARAIHRFGPRAAGPFVAVNIAALSPSLAESELFGHVQGAFTGADSDRVGLIEQAHGGTLFLDEVAEIPLGIQVKLLRVLDMGEVTPVGSNQAVKTDFRLISATHQELLSQINHGEFRHDLFYRIRTFEIKLPPLRQRKDDIGLLVEFFLGNSSQATRVTPTVEFIDELKSRPWHGNVRELQNVVERAVTMARSGVLTVDHISTEDQNISVPPSSDERVPQIQRLIAEWTREHWDDHSGQSLYEALIAVIDPAILPTAFSLSDQQYSSAARRLGIHRTTLKKKLDDLSE